MTRAVVAIVEPSESLRVLYQWMLADGDYEVMSCASAGELVSKNGGVRPRVIVLDGCPSFAEAERDMDLLKRSFPQTSVVVQDTTGHLASLGDAFLLRTPDPGHLRRVIGWLIDEPAAPPKAALASSLP